MKSISCVSLGVLPLGCLLAVLSGCGSSGSNASAGSAAAESGDWAIPKL
jgi:hypothetical protein